MRIGSLCSGYGGLDMGVQSVLGGTLAWHVEYDRDPSRILAHHWPDVPNHGDVKHTDWSAVEPVDILTAGYPCQPFSHAGKRKGADDPRHLWPDVARAIGALRPGLVVLENVRGHVSLGLADVLADLSGMGYDATWGVVRAADAGAPHGRARIFIVCEPADATGDARWLGDGNPVRTWRGEVGRAPSTRSGATADAHHVRPVPAAQGSAPRWEGARVRPVGERDLVSVQCPTRGTATEPRRPGADGPVRSFGPYQRALDNWAAITGRVIPEPTEPGRNGGRLAAPFVEWLMGLPAGHVTDVPDLSRNAQLKALGNGVVPQQAALALRTLLVVAERAA